VDKTDKTEERKAMMDQSSTTPAATERPSLFGLDPANPYPAFAQLRVLSAVAPVPLPAGSRRGAVWLVTRFDEAVQVLKDPRFTVDASVLGAPAGSTGQPRASASSDVGFFGGRSMIDVDGVDHARLRSLVSKAFTPRYIETLRPGIQRIADALLDRVQARGAMDLVQEYGYPLPITVICDMLGVPHDRRDRLLDGSAYIEDLVAEKRRHPGDDLLSQLVRMEAAGDHLDEHELRAMVALLIFAGHETTANLISIGVLTLLDHPDALARLQAEPGLIPGAIEELLRFNGPVLTPVPRFARDDVELGGQQIGRGDLVLVSLGSANHDEAVFTDPEALDIARALSRHVAFGQGAHFCLGAPLARLEGDIALRTLLRRMPGLRLNAPRESIRWRGNVSLRGLTALPVAF